MISFEDEILAAGSQEAGFIFSSAESVKVTFLAIRFECLFAGRERQNQSARQASFTAGSHESAGKSRRRVWQVVLFLMRCCSLKLFLGGGRAEIFEQIWDVSEIFFVSRKKTVTSSLLILFFCLIYQLKESYIDRSIVLFAL